MHRAGRLLKGGWILAALLFTAATGVLLRRAAGQEPAEVQPLNRADNPGNRQAVAAAVGLLRQGDLALRSGADATSYLLRQMNLTDKSFSHCGIVLIEDGYPFIYHCIGGEDNPDAVLRRDSAQYFFAPATNERLGIARLDLTGPQIQALAAVVRRYHRQALKFDMDFDMATDDRMYCAEFVYKAVREATADTGYFSLTRMLSRTYAGVDNLYDRRHAKIICDVRYK